MTASDAFFGVDRYAAALVDRLDKYFGDSATPRPEDERALVVGIYGQWGCGKTTWLEAIGARAQRELGMPRKQGDLTTMTVPVMFNAWQYEKEPHLIVPLLKTAEVAVRRALSGEAKGGEEAYWAWARERVVMLWDIAVALIAGLKGEIGGDVLGMSAKAGFDGGKTMETWAKRQADRATKGRTLPSPMDAYESLYFDLHRYMQALTGRGKRPEALAWLTEQEREIEGALSAGESLQEEDLRALGFFAQRRARKQLGKEATTPAQVGDESQFRLNLLFLIDDLDRCLPEKAVEMLESIKLFLEAPGCAFVVAVDDEIVSRGIQHRYRDYMFEERRTSDLQAGAGHGPITGSEYLEKIIHLPVHVPALELTETKDFLVRRWPDLFRQRSGTLAGFGGERERGQDEESLWDHDLLSLFLDAVPPVPRKVIRAVELFAMLHAMAERLLVEQRFGAMLYEPKMLARLVILQLHAPDIHREGGKRRGVGFLDELKTLKRAESEGKTLDDLIEEHEKRAKDAASPTPDARNQRDAAMRLAALAGHVKRSRMNRSAFDPLSVVDIGESYDWQTRVACHYRLVATESKVDFAIHGRAPGLPATPKDLPRFLDLALSENPDDWRRALAEEPELAGRVLDERSADALLHRFEQPNLAARVTVAWVSHFGRHLPFAALAKLYRITDLLAKSGSERERGRLISLACRLANPPYAVGTERASVRLAGLVSAGHSLDFRDARLRDSYLVGLDAEGALVAEDPRAWAGADLRGSRGVRPEFASHALAEPAHPPLQPSFGFGLGGLRSVCRLDENRLASAGEDGTVRVWSLASPDAEPRVLRGHSGSVRSVCRLDEDRLASAGSDGTVRVWSLASPDAEPRVLRGHSGTVWSVCRLDEDRLASAGSDGTVRVWSLASPDAEPRVLRGHSGTVWSVCRLDDDHLASAGSDGTVRVWNLASPDAEPRVLRGHSGTGRSVCRLDKDRLASAGSDGTVRVWNLASPDAEPRVLRGHSGTVWSVCRLDDDHLASAGEDGTARVWSLALPDVEPRVLRSHSGTVWSMCRLDEDRLASAGSDGTVRVWSLASPDAEPRVLRGHSGRVWSVCQLDDDRLASAGSDGTIRVWRLASPDAEPRVLRGHSGLVLSVCRLDEDRLASAGADGTVRVWSLAPDAEPRVLRGHSGWVLSVCQLDENRLASAGDDGTVRVWSLASPDAEPRVFRGHSGRVWSVCRLDDDRLASAGDDGSLRVWSLALPDAEPRVLRGHSGWVLSVCQLDDDRLASAGDDGTVRVWSLASPDAEPRVLRGHAGWVLSLYWLDDDRFASAGDDGTVRVWSLASPDAEPHVLRGHSGTVWSVCRLNDDRLASAGVDGTIRVWRGQRPAWAALMLEGGIRVVFQADAKQVWPIQITHPNRAWQTKRVDGLDLPADPELHQLAAFTTSDRSRAVDPSAPVFRVAIHEFPEAHGKLWSLSDDRRTLLLAWPSGQVEREIMQRWVFGSVPE